MKSTIVMEKRGSDYRCDAYGKFGGGFRNAFAGKSAVEASFYLITQYHRYVRSNSEGGYIIAPTEVSKLLPNYMLEVA